jgi:hypothetical protein
MHLRQYLRTMGTPSSVASSRQPFHVVSPKLDFMEH